MNVFKKIISLNYRKDVLPLQILKDPKKIFVFFPLEAYELSSLIPAIQLLRETFKTAEITGVTRKEDASFFEKSGLFNQIVSYEKTPIFPYRQFFRLRKILRNISALISIDFNSKSDVLSWMGGAPLRIGLQSSPFINYKVKVSVKDKAESALKLVRTICIGR